MGTKTHRTQQPITMRLDEQEKEALRFALKDFSGEVYLFGSRVDAEQRGGDIDILLVPSRKANSLKLSMEIQTRFFSKCEERIDVVVYDEGSPFCGEVLKNAKRLDI
ncbi:MAG: nucleotidyltransferase domain-containing protein [Nitrospirae bacterium]|nr:MAG: nucleotidyltransferase domain-containing protein [Nitrospirota bacterium]